jgi:hypothetical protein
MVQGQAGAIDDTVPRTRQAMVMASAIVLAGFMLRPDVKIVRWPDRFVDERGREFCGRVMSFLRAGRELSRKADSGYCFLGSAGDPRDSHLSSSSQLQTRPVAVSMTITPWSDTT